MTSGCYFLNLIIESNPKFKFKQDKLFSWYAAEGRICFVDCKKDCRPKDKPCENFYKLAHELGHAKLAHKDYKTRIELNRMELDAWAEAEKMINDLSLGDIPEEIIDSAMSSYVNHANQDECEKCELSLIGGICPNCSLD